MEQFLGLAIGITEHDTIECIIQKGTGNTVETSKLETVYFSMDEFSNVNISDRIQNDLIVPNKIFLLSIDQMNEWVEEIEETEERLNMFNPPDYFSGLGDTSFFNEK